LTAWAGKQAPQIRLNRLDFTLGPVLEAPGAGRLMGSLAASRPQYEGKGKCGALWRAKRMFAGSITGFYSLFIPRASGKTLAIAGNRNERNAAYPRPEASRRRLSRDEHRTQT
jgi:hypothetical protein